jgi:hypothetical protein
MVYQASLENVVIQDIQEVLRTAVLESPAILVPLVFLACKDLMVRR